MATAATFGPELGMLFWSLPGWQGPEYLGHLLSSQAHYQECQIRSRVARTLTGTLTADAGDAGGLTCWCNPTPTLTQWLKESIWLPLGEVHWRTYFHFWNKVEVLKEGFSDHVPLNRIPWWHSFGSTQSFWVVYFATHRGTFRMCSFTTCNYHCLLIKCHYINCTALLDLIPSPNYKKEAWLRMLWTKA